MATWRADVFVNSQVGRITTEVEAATFSGAKQQIYAKHGDVQQITNLREVSSNSSSSGSSEIDGAGVIGLVGLAAAAWAFVSFTPIIAMIGLGAAATWISQFIVGQTVEEYVEREDDSGHGKAAIVLTLALIAGGFGFVKGTVLQKQWNTPEVPAQVQSK